ncbi:prolyl 3-hydroxylase OGFOD1 [Athalia rosae]|uniref:prolyl 3-hydroxylase OGFOD1 n=1 Tax=Athalia rosae TaxID=37344 RepID=UPI0020331E6A|nr:prolyl 3-hydroxylase OGFOD1 [Athalia rosae]
MTSNEMDQSNKHEPSTKRMKSSIISDHVESLEFKKLFVKHWLNLEPVKTKDIEIITDPYRICKISNFLRDDDFISQIKEELKEVESNRKTIDLYQFEQTVDLANVQSKNIDVLYRTFESDVTNWMEQNTQIILNGKMSMSSASYSDTDYLLCHDDNMGDRRIAFILYLSKDWAPEDGGALDIFDSDTDGQPKNIVMSLVPEYNSLVFFEVTDNSYHQVAEITSPDKLRISINGWFHGPLKESNKQLRPEIIHEYFEPEDTDIDLVSQISKIYLYETIVENIQQAIEKDSFIYLPDFLLPEIYEKLGEEIKSQDIKWSKIGPADLQNYEIANDETLPETLKAFYNIFKSIHFFHLLKRYTELDLVPESNDMKPKMQIELQRWSRGCYMLINDQTIEPIHHREKNGNETDNIIKSKVESDVGMCKKTEDNMVNKSKYENDDAKQNTTADPIKTSGDSIPDETGNDSKTTKNAAQNPHHENQTIVKNKLAAKGKCKTLFPTNESPQSSGNFHKKGSTAIIPDESDSSDIEDYMSDLESESESNTSEKEDMKDEEAKPGTLDVILQFHTENATEDATIDYVDPSVKDGALIHIPPQDNHLCLVYRTADTCRCNKYVNHYSEGYFYTLLCSYYE